METTVVETQRKQRKKREKKKVFRVATYFEKNTYERIKQYADKHGVAISTLINLAVTKFIEENH